MFARRITIVSLMTILFGLVTAQIVAQAGRERRIGGEASVAPCTFDVSLRCTAR